MTSTVEPIGERIDERDQPWPWRPWAMAALCAVMGWIFWQLIEPLSAGATIPWRAALATGVAVATIIFTLGVERRRWHWAAAFAALWGVVSGFVAWHTGGYNVGGSMAEWPFFSCLLAAVIAAPMFQTKRDVADDWRFWRLWQLPYRQLHLHAWTDAVLGAVGMAFVGIVFLLAWQISALFQLIGIEWVRDLLQKSWFGWMLAGAAFGGAIGLLRERDKLVGTLQRLVMIVLAVLAPVLAASLALFLLTSIGTGFAKLWESGFSATALMLSVAAAAVLFANAVIGNGDEDQSRNRVLHWSAALLAALVLPLSVIAAVAMGLRIGEYGWTPERIWGVIAVGTAFAYGLGGLWSLVRGRASFDDILRPLQQKIAIALGVLALLLALPIVDFGAMSARDQVARLRSGAVSEADFDLRAMAFDFGPAGRAALQQMARSGTPARRAAITAALAAENRYGVDENLDEQVDRRPLAQRLRIIPAGRALPPAAMTALEAQYHCAQGACVALWIDDRRIAYVRQSNRRDDPQSAILYRHGNGIWNDVQEEAENRGAPRETPTPDLATATVELRNVPTRQIMVDGKLVGSQIAP